MEVKSIVCVDPGASNGGIAFWKQGDPVKCVRMPKDLTDLKPYFQHIAQTYPDTVVFMEKVQMFGSDADNPGKAYRIKVMLANYEQMKALVVYFGLRFVEVYPISWQTRLGLKKTTKGMEDKDRKAYYKVFAQNAFPEIKVTLWNSDALCLVQFALTAYERTPSWITERLQNVKKGLF